MDRLKPEYLSYKGNTLHRDHAGQGTELVYTNTTGRNDIVGAKVARDADYLYFYVETADDLTDKADPKWMRLFIDIDRNKSTGWEGYDFVINRAAVWGKIRLGGKKRELLELEYRQQRPPTW